MSIVSSLRSSAAPRRQTTTSSPPALPQRPYKIRSSGNSRRARLPLDRKQCVTIAAAPSPTMRTVATAPRPGGVKTMTSGWDDIRSIRRRHKGEELRKRVRRFSLRGTIWLAKTVQYPASFVCHQRCGAASTRQESILGSFPPVRRGNDARATAEKLASCSVRKMACSQNQRPPRRRTSVFLACWLGVALSLSALAAPRADAGLELFEKEIRPLLVQHCQKCHGQEKAQAGLRLDSRAAILKGGGRGPAAVLGDPEGSLLIKAVRQTGELEMP